MRNNAFKRAFMVFHLTWHFYRLNCAVIIMDAFRNLKCQFNISGIRQRVAMFLRYFPIKIGVTSNDTHFSYLMDLFYVRPFRSFRMDVRSRQGDIVASRTRIFFSPRDPSQRGALCLLIIRRHLSRNICFIQIRSHV